MNHLDKIQKLSGEIRKEMSLAASERMGKHGYTLEQDMIMLEQQIDRDFLSAELLIILYRRFCDDLPSKLDRDE